MTLLNQCRGHGREDMNVIVTGAGGFLGKHVVAALCRRGHNVSALCFPPGAVFDEPQVELLEDDLLEDDLSGAFNGVEAVIHLAMLMRGSDAELHRIAVEGTRRLLNAMIQSTCRRVVLVSSFSVYDWSKVGRTLHENSPVLDEHSAVHADGYAKAKLQQEKLAREMCGQHKLELTVLRPASLWGGGKMPMSVMGQSAGPLTVLFAPLAPMKFTYVENCAEMFALCLERPETIGQTINIVDTDRVTVHRAYNEHRRRRGGGMTVPVPYRLGHAAAALVSSLNSILFCGKLPLPGMLKTRQFEARFKPVACDNDRMRRLLAWNQPFVFERALERAYENNRKTGDA